MEDHLKNNKVRKFVIDQWKTVTIEPVILLYSIGFSIISGAEITTNLLMWKVCHLQLNYSSEVCANLSAAANEEIQKIVQEDVNNFSMISQWISSAPVVVFSIIAGALSDVFGRKPLMLLPMIGDLIGYIFLIINYAFIEVLPLEFFYLGNFSSFFGGYAVYYLGVYSYGTTVTQPRERAHRLTRLDGFETIAIIIGTLLSPLIFKKLGYYGNYGINCVFVVLAIAYLIYFVEEPIIIAKSEKEQVTTEKVNLSMLDKSDRLFEHSWKVIKSFLHNAIAIPLQGMKEVIAKDRKLVLKFLICVQFLCFATYWLTLQIWTVMYLYMLLVFEDFDETGYAHFNVAISVLNTFGLMVVMPIMSGKFQIHDAMMLFIVLMCEVVGSFIAPFVTTLWQFYLANGLGTLGYCKYGLVRSLLSNCIDPSEVGKVFSLLSVIASVAPIAGNPLFRQLYNKTLNTFPGAIFLLFGSVLFFSALGNLFLYFMRHHIKPPITCEESIGNDEKSDGDSLNTKISLDVLEKQSHDF